MSRWSREQCERWFIQTPRVSLKELETLGSVPFSTLKKWQAAGNWVQRRKQFQAELSEEIRDQTIEKTAAEVSDRWAQVADELTDEHLQAFQICRRLTQKRVEAIETQICKLQTELNLQKAMGQSTSELEAELDATIARINLDDLMTCSQVIDRCVKGERLVLSAEYLDLNRAIAAIERTGLQVVAPSDAVIQRISNHE